MGYYAIIGGEQQVPLASLSGWSEFKAWADTLDASDEISHLCEYGFSQNIPALIAQLEASIPAGSVGNTVRDLIGNLRAAPEGAESIFVSDGMGDEDAADIPLLRRALQ